MEAWGIALYSIDAGNGALTFIKSVFQENGAGNVRATPSGKFLYFLSADTETTATGSLPSAHMLSIL